jgi:hypothetical protein
MVNGRELTTDIRNIERLSEGAYQTNPDDPNQAISKVNLPHRLLVFQEHEKIFFEKNQFFLPLIIEGKHHALDLANT